MLSETWLPDILQKIHETHIFCAYSLENIRSKYHTRRIPNFEKWKATPIISFQELRSTDGIFFVTLYLTKLNRSKIQQGIQELYRRKGRRNCRFSNRHIDLLTKILKDENRENKTAQSKISANMTEINTEFNSTDFEEITRSDNK